MKKSRYLSKSGIFKTGAYAAHPSLRHRRALQLGERKPLGMSCEASMEQGMANAAITALPMHHQQGISLLSSINSCSTWYVY